MNKIFSKYIPIFFIFLSVLFLLFVIYKAEYFHQGTKSYYYKIYYIIGLLSLFFSIINFFLKKELKIKTSIIILSIFFSFYLIEGFLLISGIGLKNYPNLMMSVPNKLEKDPNFDTRTLIEIYDDMKIEDKNITTVVHPTDILKDSNQQLFQLSGISNTKTILCNENGYYAIYQSDRYGFNNPDGQWGKKQIAFFLVGDSYVHGACVNEKNTIAGNIRKKIEVGAVLNLGKAANGPLIEYATLREYLPLTNTKKVLWFFNEGNDLLNLSTELTNKILLNYLNDENFSQNLYLKQNDIDTKVRKIVQKERSREQQALKTNQLLRFTKLSFLRRYTTEQLSFDPTVSLTDEQTLEKLIEIISLSKNFTQKQGAKFYFIYIPHPSRYRMEELFDSKVQVDLEKYIIAENNTPDFKNYEKIINSVKNLDIPVIDIYKELHLTLKDPVGLYPFRLPGHYNELGYKLIVETVLKKIEEYDRLE
tara:strand:+ start:120 stop:1550 length:1431 start_codon:yes stop_codon:yes gene_type:complete